jgi:hypothetical protein
MKMRNLLPAVLAIALTVAAGFYVLRQGAPTDETHANADAAAGVQ